MQLEQWIDWARGQGASDLHLEPGLPATLRIRGELRVIGERVSGQELADLVRDVLGEGAWNEFLARCSADLSRTVRGVRCRVNALRTSRGVGLAIRLLSAPAATLRRLNLHPDLLRLVQARNGLVLVTGPTGSGKTTTLAALLEEVNLSEARHILTLESPIEYSMVPRRSLVRQREVGRDTPSFAQGLYDAMREDPDVLMVGEMREPEVMRLTLNAAETGHLVLATVHSSSSAEALQRIVGAMPAEVQPSICAQLADCLVGVVAQQLIYREAIGMCVPECEVLMCCSGAKSVIRQSQFFKLGTVIESSAAEGCWSFARYRAWLDAKTDWARPGQMAPEQADAPELPEPDIHPVLAPAPIRRAAARPELVKRKRSSAPEQAQAEEGSREDGVLVLDDAPDDPSSVMQELERKR
jgi:twitching motility protein PilT